jgi:hypothetical protein
MTSIFRRSVAAGAVAAVAAFGSAGVAFAATTSGPASTTASSETWQQVHDKVAKALSDRQTTLTQLTASAGSNGYLTATDRQALQSLLAAETQGINQLAATVAAATPQNTTVAQLRQDAVTMVHQYRVYLVMAPKVHLSEAADNQTDVELRLSLLEPRFQAAMTRAGNPSDAVQAYRDLLTQLGNATSATGKADIPAVLQVSPPGYPSDGGPLATARASLQAAGNDLKSARSDIQIIRNAIQQGKASGPAGATGATSSTS